MGILMKTFINIPARTLILTATLMAGTILSACSEMNSVINELQTMTTSALPKQSNTEKVNASPKVTTSSSSKTDLVGLLGWFENSCGFDSASSINGTKENQISNRFEAFQETFIAQKYTSDGNYTTYVKPDYRSKLPTLYNNAIQNITVTEDSEGVHYYVNFNNATYRGYDLSRLELFYQPETDYAYDVLHFKHANFVELAPIFKTTEDDMGEIRGGGFDAPSRTVNCYLGL